MNVSSIILFLQNLIDDGEDLIQEERYEEAIEKLTEAYDFDMWRRMYGAVILLNLAFANCQIGNYTIAREHLLDIDSFYGEEFLQEEEKLKLDEMHALMDEKEDTVLHIHKKQNFSLDQEIEDYEDSFYETQSPKEIKKILKTQLQEELKESSLKEAVQFKTQFQYKEAIAICLNHLKKNKEDEAAHALLMEIFLEVGSRCDLVIDARKDLEEILMLK